MDIPLVSKKIGNALDNLEIPGKSLTNFGDMWRLKFGKWLLTVYPFRIGGTINFELRKQGKSSLSKYKELPFEYSDKLEEFLNEFIKDYV